MKLSKSSMVLALGMFAFTAIHSANASDYEISQFRQAIQQIQMYEQQYQAAPSGSWQEQQANQGRVQAEANAEAVINSPYAFQGFNSSQDQNLMNEFNNGYQAAPSGSLIERAYRAARDVATRAFSQTLTNEQMYQLQSAYDYNQALQLTLNAENQYQAAPSGSTVEAVYNNIRAQGWTITNQKFQQFASQLQDFHQTETLYFQFENQYQAAASGSKIEAFYNQGRATLKQKDFELFTRDVNYMSYQQLASVEIDYENRYQSAASGSSIEAYYRTLRDIARNRLNGMQPMPTPFPPMPTPFPPMPTPFPPQPTPFPQPGRIVCEIHAGANAAGQHFFRVMLPSGAIIATFATTQEAANFAQNDPRCRQ